jgi:hypothetical protein
MQRCWSLQPEDRPTFTELTGEMDQILLSETAEGTGYLKLADWNTQFTEEYEEILPILSQLL